MARDKGNWDFDHRLDYGSERKLSPYGGHTNQNNWAFDRCQHSSNSMRRHYLKHCKTRTRQLLKEDLNLQLADC